MPSMTVEPVVPSGDDVAESPRWDADSRRLYWIDAVNPAVHTLSGNVPATSRRGPVVTSIALGAEGVGLATGPTGLHEFDHRSDPAGIGSLLLPYPGLLPGVSPNDSAVDPAGRLLVGLGCETVRGRGSVVTFSAEGEATGTLVTGLFWPNGMAWSADGTRFYLADSYERVVHSFRYDAESGSVVGAPVPLCVSTANILPDGIAVDAEDHIWVAYWGGGSVVRYTPDGRETARVTLPTTNVSSCVFGGDELTDLFVTTAGSHADDPVAGGLWVVRNAGAGFPSWRVPRRVIGGGRAARPASETEDPE